MTKYQVMPPLSEEEYAALKAGVAENGVQVPIVEDEDGNVLDGHHRKRAWEELKSLGFDLPDLPRDVKRDLSEQEKWDLAVSLNLQRRHLNRHERRQVIASLLRRTPERSDRWLAEIAAVDHMTVGAVRRDLESRGELPHLDRLHGKDGKTYTRLTTGAYEDEDRRKDQEHHAETRYLVRRAIREWPDATVEEIAEEFDTTAEYVAEQRDDLFERGLRAGDHWPTPDEAIRSANRELTAEEKREGAREQRAWTKVRKDVGELKSEDARRAVERLMKLDSLLNIAHPNENRRITPKQAAEAFAQYWLRRSSGFVAQGDLEFVAYEDLKTVARVANWIEEFVPAFARTIDEILDE